MVATAHGKTESIVSLLLLRIFYLDLPLVQLQTFIERQLGRWRWGWSLRYLGTSGSHFAETTNGNLTVSADRCRLWPREACLEQSLTQVFELDKTAFSRFDQNRVWSIFYTRRRTKLCVYTKSIASFGLGWSVDTKRKDSTHEQKMLRSRETRT